MAKILPERLKTVVPKLIHSDQKVFAKCRNISEANRLVQDIIDYIDQEDEEAILVLLDQQKAFDRVEWGWEDYALKEFNFGKSLGGGLKCCLMEQKHVSKQMGFSQNMSQYLDLVDRGFQ